MSKDWFQDVLEFHKTFGLTINTEPQTPNNGDVVLRLSLVAEEYKEFRDAVALNEGHAAIADALADLIYVTIGTAITYGIDLRPVWDEVQRANMAKAGGPKREDGKQLKPEGWKPPDIEAALKKGKIDVDLKSKPT